jgi:hypothetical protein
MLSLLSGDISVGGATVGAMVGSSFVGVTGSAVGVGDTTAREDVSAGVTGSGSGGVDVGAGEQAVMRTTARMSTLIRLQGLAIFSFSLERIVYYTSSFLLPSHKRADA